MSVSRELRIAGGSESIQKKESGSYFVEAQYIEFEGVKVGAGTLTFNFFIMTLLVVFTCIQLVLLYRLIISLLEFEIQTNAKQF